MFEIKFTKSSVIDVAKLRETDAGSFRKLDKLLDELKRHPERGTGHPEQLKGTSVTTWSRHISAKHRLVYEIQEKEVVILSAYGHYGDK